MLITYNALLSNNPKYKVTKWSDIACVQIQDHSWSSWTYELLESHHPFLQMEWGYLWSSTSKGIVLDLQSSKLVGFISPHVGNLSFLKNLTLQNNSFHNEILPEIGRLCKLQFLQLQNNTLSGKIHNNLTSCTHLEGLHVSYNLLSGEIPTIFGILSKLWIFSIYNNYLTGSIMLSFGNLSPLEAFRAYNNNLVGTIPSSFGQFTKLSSFTSSSNSCPVQFLSQSSVCLLYKSLIEEKTWESSIKHRFHSTKYGRI